MSVNSYTDTEKTERGLGQSPDDALSQYSQAVTRLSLAVDRCEDLQRLLISGPESEAAQAEQPSMHYHSVRELIREGPSRLNDFAARIEEACTRLQDELLA